MKSWAVLMCVSMGCGLAVGQGTQAARPAITGISHMTLYADDLKKSEAFYAGLLGWEPEKAGAGERFYANHEQYVELVTAPSPGLEKRFVAVGFSTPDAEGMRRYLGEHGVEVPAAVSVDERGNRSIAVKDPEGNRIEFTQQGPHAPKGGKAAAERVSGDILHAGLVAHDRAALDRFYQDVLGFHLLWAGGSGPGHTDWVMMQVGEGQDWLEYMLYLTPAATREQLGGAYHFSPGVVSVTELAQKLKKRGWKDAETIKPLLGVDAKWQLDLRDPDGTRVEFMEFKPVKEPCCRAFTGTVPQPRAAW